VLVDMLCFGPAQAAMLVEAFGGRVAQLLFCSTACVYELEGLARRGRWPDETAPAASRWHYGRGKAASEAVVLEADRRGLFHVTIFRPSHVYAAEGLVHPLGADGRRVLGRVEQGLPVLVLDGGEAPWQACHASDAGVAFAAACLEPRCYGRVYNVAHREVFCWRDLLDAFGRTVGRAPRIYSLPAEALARRARPDLDEFALELGRHGLAIDASRLHRELPDFGQRVSLDEGLRRAWLQTPAPPSLDYDPGLEQLLEREATPLGLA
jgi:nucleoside-diphosphate-sugar epimerase